MGNAESTSEIPGIPFSVCHSWGVSSFTRLHAVCRYDEFGRVKRKNRGGDDRRSREEAALARLRGEHTAYHHETDALSVPMCWSATNLCCFSAAWSTIVGQQHESLAVSKQPTQVGSQKTPLDWAACTLTASGLPCTSPAVPEALHCGIMCCCT